MGASIRCGFFIGGGDREGVRHAACDMKPAAACLGKGKIPCRICLSFSRGKEGFARGVLSSNQALVDLRM